MPSNCASGGRCAEESGESGWAIFGENGGSTQVASVCYTQGLCGHLHLAFSCQNQAGNSLAVLSKDS